MRLAIFCDSSPQWVNGVTTYYKQFIDHVQQNGARVDFHILSNKKNTTQVGKNCRLFEYRPGVTLPIPVYPEYKLGFISAYTIQNRYEVQPDAILVSTPGPLGLAARRFAKRFDIPCVAFFHTDYASVNKILVRHFFKNRLEWFAKTISWLTEKYQKYFYSAFHEIICESHFAKKAVSDYRIPAPVHMIPTGVSLERFNPKFNTNRLRKEFGLSSKPVLLYVGRISFEKNLQLLIEVYERHKDKFHLVFVGDGPAMAQLRSNTDAVFTGYAKGQTLSEYYASADVFVCPSHVETYGIVVLEAMASGLPVIVAGSGGSKELVVSGDNGLVFEKGNASALEAKILELVSDEKKRCRLAKRALQYAEMKDVNMCFTQILEILSGCNGNGKHNTPH